MRGPRCIPSRSIRTRHRPPPCDALPCPRLDAYFEIGLGGCWDLAAGVLVLEEAGGKVLDPEGGPFGLMGRRVLGTNAHLGAQVAAVLAAVGSAPAEPQPPA